MALELLVLIMYLKVSFMNFSLKMRVGMDDTARSAREVEIKNLLLYSNVLSLILLLNKLMVFTLEIQWMKSKNNFHPLDNFWTTGYWKHFLMCLPLFLIQPYWFLIGSEYKDSAFNEFSKDLVFQVNDVLTVIQIFFKMIPIYIHILYLTNWTTPKS